MTRCLNTGIIQQRQASNPLSNRLLGESNDISDGLIGVLEILFKSDVVLDLEEDEGSANDKRASEEAPGNAKHGGILELSSIESKEDGGTSRLDTLVEAYQKLIMRKYTNIQI